MNIAPNPSRTWYFRRFPATVPALLLRCRRDAASPEIGDQSLFRSSSSAVNSGEELPRISSQLLRRAASPLRRTAFRPLTPPFSTTVASWRSYPPTTTAAVFLTLFPVNVPPPLPLVRTQLSQQLHPIFLGRTPAMHDDRFVICVLIRRWEFSGKLTLFRRLFSSHAGDVLPCSFPPVFLQAGAPLPATAWGLCCRVLLRRQQPRGGSREFLHYFVLLFTTVKTCAMPTCTLWNMIKDGISATVMVVHLLNWFLILQRYIPLLIYTGEFSHTVVIMFVVARLARV